MPGAADDSFSETLSVSDELGASATVASAGGPVLTTDPDGGIVGEQGRVQPGTPIGRYVVLSRLGAGAMGVVLAAYDPELDRKVALKLLKQRGKDEESARLRLQREAQALAKLGHPNVVAVHDVGVHEGQLFVGMEFVEGKTLGEWMAEVKTPRPWREVLPVLEAAGRGLAAAHAAGLVHRDFKPDNVMLGDDGRVRVMDFGLARAREDAPGTESIELTESVMQRELGDRALDSQLTRTGTMMGTPAYMAREQWERSKADARSDQFAFCVTLYEALYGHRPFEGTTLMALAWAVREGKVETAPRGSTVPGWLRAVVLRGLSPEPEKRWPDMESLLTALGDDPAQRRRQWLVGVAVVGVFGGLAGAAVMTREEPTPVCAGMDAPLEGVWDETRRAEVRSALVGSDLAYAADTADRVERALDDYASTWASARQDACQAHHRGEQSARLLDLRMACLDRRLDHLRATVEVLVDSDRSIVARAAQMAAKLPDLEQCSDADALEAEIRPPDDPEVAKEVQRLEGELARALALQQAGRYDEGLQLAKTVTERAAQLDYEPLRVRAWQRLGELQSDSGDYEAAAETLELAVESALALQMANEGAGASAILIFVLGTQLHRPEDALEWERIARPLARAAGTGTARGRYENAMGLIARQQRRLDDARTHYRAAIEHWESPVRKADSMDNLGVLETGAGNFEEARKHHARALEIKERELGPDHPDVAGILINLGNAAHGEKRNDEAIANYRRGLEILEASLGPEHPNVGVAAANVGMIEAEQGEFEAAKAHIERARAIFVAKLGPKHANVGHLDRYLGDVEAQQEHWEEASTHYRSALVILEEALGTNQVPVAGVLHNLGEWSRRLDKYPQAIADLERSLAIRVEIDEKPAEIASTRFALARALWDAPPDEGRDHKRATRLAKQALATQAEAGEEGKEKMAEVEAWLEERGI